MNRKKIKMQIVFLVIFFLAAGLAALVNYRNFEQKRDRYYARLQGELSTAYGVTVFDNQETARIVFDTYINQPEILELYKNANSADESVRNEVRQQLYKKLLPVYDLLKLRNVRQLQFHLTNSESFLRFIRQEKYGDSLKGLRYSVDKANAELVAVSGFEEGRIIDGFRNVFPLVYHGQHLGSVEISMDFDAIRKRMKHQFHNRYAFMVRRQLVKDIVFADEQKNYRPSDLSDDYLYERNYAADDTLQAINAVLKPKIQERLKAGEGFVLEVKGHDAARLVAYFPVKNVHGQQAAYIVSYRDDATISGYYAEFVVTLAISIAGILVIVLLIYLLTNALGLSRANEERLEMVLKGAELGMWDWHIPSGEMVFNERWAQMLGYKLEEIEPDVSSWEKLVHPDDMETVMAILTDHLEGRSPVYQSEYRLRAKSGKWKWILDTGKVLERDKDGKPVRMLGIHRDITDRKQAEEALRRSEARLNEAQRIAHVGNWELDLITNTLFWSDEIYIIFGLEPQQFGATYEAFLDNIHPDDRELVNNAYTESVKNKTPYNIVHRLLLKDGTVKFVNERCETFYDDAGKALRSIGTVQDITARKRAEERLFNEREKLFVTLQSIGDGVITTDTEGRVTFMNGVAEQLTAWSQEEAAGQPLSKVFTIINEKTGLPCENPMKKVLDSGKIIGLANHTALIARDSTRRSIADSGAPILDAQGKISGVVLVFRDVTEEKKREEEQRKIKKLESVGVLAGGIAHDFNNILMAILGNINLADISIGKDHQAHRLLQAAEKASLRAKDLTSQLLTFAKGGDPVRKTTSITQVITDSADFVLHGSNVKCRYAIPEDLWLVDIDSGQMSQVIQNLVINARHAMPEGGEINISGENIADITTETALTLPGEKWIKITIADTGGGIPEKYLDKIFDPYFSTKQQGSGLGLAITHSIITKHDGHIFVRSKSGEGTTFTIYLPAATEQKSREVKEEAQQPEKTARGTILVMDDEEMIQDVAKEMLSSFGHEVLQAKDGEEAIAIFKERYHSDNPVDVIIMDLTIPGGMGGKEAIKEILKIDPDAKAIVSSGYANDPVMANYRRYGFKAAIGKPFQMAQLRETINSVLG